MRQHAPSLPNEDYNSAAEVIANLELPPKEERKAWEEIEKAWKACSGRFYAYATACRIAGKIKEGITCQ